MTGTRRGILVAAIVVLVVGYLVAGAFSSGAVYYLTVEELQARGAGEGRPVRVSGYVAPGSVDWQPERLLLRFRLQAREDGGPAVPVVYRGARPDLLAERVQVIVEGRVADGVLVARQVLVKCPSKYEPAAGS